MYKEPYFDWDEETGTALCLLEDKQNCFVGYATCHEDDRDMCSKRTGCEIALYRAEIDYFQHVRDNELMPSIKALRQLYYSMNKSKYFNQKSYETKMLQRQIRLLEEDLATIKQMLTETRRKLKQYIDDKENVYQKIRANRKAKSN